MKETFVTQIVQPVEDNIGAGRIEQIRVFIERFVKQPFEAVMLFGENHTLAFSVVLFDLQFGFVSRDRGTSAFGIGFVSVLKM